MVNVFYEVQQNLYGKHADGQDKIFKGSISNSAMTKKMQACKIQE